MALQYHQTIIEIQQDLINQKLNLPDLVEYYLQQIKDHAELNAFIEVFTEEAQLAAKTIQEKIQNHSYGKLTGLIIGIKDNICYADHQVSAGSKILNGYVSVYSSTVVKRLVEEDAIIIGRLNCDEFAMGASNETSYFGPVKNFADQRKVSGGSSGGSAVAVQAGLCHAALGTDTGGSVRQPAAFCGVIGLKPTYGRVSRHGIIAYASSFDQVGPITKSVEDAALLLEVIAGPDEYDSTTSSITVDNYSENVVNIEKKRIAYFPEVLEAEGLDEEIKVIFKKSINSLTAAGNIVEPVAFPYLNYLIPAYYILTTAEASSNLARYDGIHFGYRSLNATDLKSTYKRTRSEGFGIEVKRRIMLGTFVLSAGYYDAYYTKAQKVRRIIRNKTHEILKDYDFILLPTIPAPAYNIGEKIQDPLIMFLGDIFTVQASLAGVPAISLPMGNNREKLPLGLQLMGKPFGEKSSLNFSHQFLKLAKNL